MRPASPEPAANAKMSEVSVASTCTPTMSAASGACTAEEAIVAVVELLRRLTAAAAPTEVPSDPPPLSFTLNEPAAETTSTAFVAVTATEPAVAVTVEPSAMAAFTSMSIVLTVDEPENDFEAVPSNLPAANVHTEAESTVGMVSHVSSGSRNVQRSGSFASARTRTRPLGAVTVDFPSIVALVFGDAAT